MSIQRDDAPRVIPVGAWSAPGSAPGVPGFEGSLWPAGRAVLALTAVAVLLLGLVRVPGGPSAGASAVLPPHASHVP